MCLLLKIESPRMSMILYSLDSIFPRNPNPQSESTCEPGAQPAKNRNLCQIIPEKVQKTRNVSRINNMCSNLNLGPGAQTTKNRKFLHVTRKSVIRPRIMQVPSLYAQNCSKLSRDPLKPCLLKSSNTYCM
jgi:hypothetical protein